MEKEKIIAIERELALLNDAEAQSTRALFFGFKVQKDKLKEELAKLKSSSIKSTSLEVEE